MKIRFLLKKKERKVLEPLTSCLRQIRPTKCSKKLLLVALALPFFYLYKVRQKEPMGWAQGPTGLIVRAL
jgi:hypothetical protein